MKKTVFLTGATGNMGWAGFQELLKKTDRFNIRILARPSSKNKKKLAPYAQNPSVEVVWGDLTCYNDVFQGVTGAHFVLHVGGMVSPQADYYPEKTLKVNVSSAENIVKAVLAQPNADDVKVVYIGSVAQCGDRMPPIHWGRAGEPVRASRFDMYSVSKCQAERLIVDSGIKHWVSLRQSGILYAGIFGQLSPTAMHVPVGGVLEWATIEDSGRLLANVVEPWVPDEFWNRFYNIGSGEEYRLVNYEFEKLLLAPMGISGPEKVFEANWFTTGNFHGMWYLDGDVLENYLHFRENLPVAQYFKRLAAQLPWYSGLARFVPSCIIKAFMRKFAFEKGLGTQSWTNGRDPEKMAAYYGSEEEYAKIKGWDSVLPRPVEKNLDRARAAGEVRPLELGWDDSKPIYELTLEEIRAAAAFRGGEFLGTAGAAGAASGGAATSGVSGGAASGVAAAGVASGVAATKPAWFGEKGRLYKWRCEHGHEFEASLEYVLLGGGWCPDCDPTGADATSKNQFLSQVL